VSCVSSAGAIPLIGGEALAETPFISLRQSRISRLALQEAKSYYRFSTCGSS
jgi:hypothetical protein